MIFAQAQETIKVMAHNTNSEIAIMARRLVDVVAASTGLLLSSPIMALVALSIWIESGRPIFFSQVRLGKAGRPFRIHKFRKFRRDSGFAGRSVTVKNDSRMTRLGRLLESAKLDELPQLWNILKGDMAIVGPRPESLDFADCFTGKYLRVLEHKPGIFGPSQALFREEGRLYPDRSDPEPFYRSVLFPLKADVDLAYFSRRTILSDLRWIIRGVLAVLGLRVLPRDAFSTISGHDPGKFRQIVLDAVGK